MLINRTRNAVLSFKSWLIRLLSGSHVKNTIKNNNNYVDTLQNAE